MKEYCKLCLHGLCEAYTTPIEFKAMVFNATFNNISVISWWSVEYCMFHIDNKVIVYDIYNASLTPAWGCRSRDRTMVGFITTYAIRVYHH
jgi:hypothetical protein